MVVILLSPSTTTICALLGNALSRCSLRFDSWGTWHVSAELFWYGYGDLLSIGWSRIGKTHRSKAGVETAHVLSRRSLRESRNRRSSRRYRSRSSSGWSGSSGSRCRGPQYVNPGKQDVIRELTGLRPAAISAQVILMVLISEEGVVGVKCAGAEVETR